MWKYSNSGDYNVKKAYQVYHPNIGRDGRVCVKKSWCSSLTIFQLLLVIYARFSNPEPDDPIDCEIAQIYKTQRIQYDENARDWTKKYATASQKSAIDWIKRSTQLKKLMNAYCDRQSVDISSIAFLFDGRRLRAEQTPDELEWRMEMRLTPCCTKQEVPLRKWVLQVVSLAGEIYKYIGEYLKDNVWNCFDVIY
ncbi:small ubiquitin-related modifier 1 [Quercus suber]|uniref:Small ubiquitin-related modifier 1 n=1 Tax=Quercus suber TaxID=58331 RepID=A0AAW0LZZ0_QUESU